MPGLFGSLGVATSASEDLHREFLQCWPDAVVDKHPGGFIGGQAFEPHQAVFRGVGNQIVAVDGEWALYQEAARHLPHEPQNLFYFEARSGGLNTSSVGTVAVLDPIERRILIATDSTGTFPLYLCEHGGGLLFSSLLRPLARAIKSRPDGTAVLEFLRQAYTVGEKSLFLGIRRLLPGQVALFSDGRLTLLERSTAWVGTEDISPAEAAELAWDRLVRAERRAIPSRSATLMMSGGWDSRTLLAVASAADRQVDCYSHGDVTSRELELVQAVCRAGGAECHLEPIDDKVVDIDLMQLGFRRTGNVVFPHWHYSGRLLAEAGAPCVIAGVYGEILGGHYGPPMLAVSPLAKTLSVASLLLLRRNLRSNGARLTSAHAELAVPSLQHHWYLKREYEESLRDPLARMNDDINTSIERLEVRGVLEPAALLEAFISEHRGTQYINAQLRSVRGWTDVSAPFAGGEVFTFATRIPIEAKIHNSLNRRMLARRKPVLLRHPMAATLIAARAPIMAQEASRVVRKALEKLGSVGMRRLGWVNFEFLRGGDELHGIIDDLSADIWDTAAMHRTVERSTSNPEQSMHPLYDQIAKIYTVDLHTR